MAEPQPEKRSSRRFFLDLPVAVKFLDDGTYEVTGHTRDVSARGVFFYMSSEIVEGTSVEFVMTLPAEITLTDPIRVHCSGKVVRVDKADDEQGVAVAIEKYHFVHET
ncbi:MAG TPA: PilZ domain-containing protein [Candidatus Angelobacter sp.]|nr:PilZ domain-containing protein [Candidatus Angelobacter sp.]